MQLNARRQVLMHSSYISVSLPTGLGGSYKANHSLQDPRNTLYNALHAHDNSTLQLHFHLEPELSVKTKIFPHAT